MHYLNGIVERLYKTVVRLAIFVTAGTVLPVSAGTAVSLDEALAHATRARAELRMAGARIEAARQRPTIVAALDDPVISPSIDHRPVDRMMGSDRSITVEQSFPLSRIRSHKRDAALASVGKAEGEAAQSLLKVRSDAANAFFMLHERRRSVAIVAAQLALARQLAALTVVRHGNGAAAQLDVLRLETEVARLQNRYQLGLAAVASAEAMFNAAIGVAPGSPVPELNTSGLFARIAAVPSLSTSLEMALSSHPGVRISRAEIARARAEVDVMKSMYSPMAMVRVGKAETMAAGKGYMLMVGISVPIWFDRLKAGVREARAMQTMAEADREAMITMIGGEVGAAHAALRGAAASFLGFESDLVPRAQRMITPAIADYSSGRVPLSGVLEATRAAWIVQEEQAMAEAALGQAWVRHAIAVGSMGE